MDDSPKAPQTNMSKKETATMTHRDANEAANVIAETARLSKKFNWFSMLATCVSLMATWEAFCSTMATGLISGGPVSLVYGFILAFIGTLATVLSLSECASIWPTAGGQYHFVAMLAPPSSRRVLTWFAGWTTTFGWQSVAASAPFLAGIMIQGLLVLNYPEYGYERWHGTLLYWAVLVFSLIVNIFLTQLLPTIQILTMALHVIFFFILLIAMTVAAPTKNSAEFVFTEFVNSSGWENDGVAWCIGMLSASYVLVGYDGATHLSEEMDRPSIGLPRAMIGSIVINGALGFAFLLAVLFCIQDLEAALTTTTGFPILEIFYQATSSLQAANAMSAAIVIMASLATVPLVASAARMLWALARDAAFPFSSTLSRVDEKRGVPTIAIIVTTIFLALLGLLNIGSTSAFNAILSLSVIGLYLSYLLPVILILYRRVRHPSTIEYGPFRLGKLGIAINVVSVVYTVFTSIFLLFPPYQPVTAVNMNYASVVLAGILLFSAVWWFWHGRKNYEGPLVELLARTETNDVKVSEA